MEDAKNSSAVRGDSESGLFHMQHHGTMLHVDEATNQREEYWENLRPGNRGWGLDASANKLKLRHITTYRILCDP